MRTLLLAGAAVTALAGSMVGPVHAADLYQPAPGYSEAPPAYGPPPAYRPPPRYGYVAPPPPPMYGPPPVVAYDDDDDVEFAPPLVYREVPVYGAPRVYAERPRYRDCGWGHRRCGPRHGW
jgi:hypothetical protein